MNQHQRNMAQRTRNVMMLDMLSGIMHQLVEQEYHHGCFQAINGERLSTGKEEFTVSQVGNYWHITQHGLNSWSIRFQVGEGYLDGTHSGYIHDTQLIHMSGLSVAASVALDLFEIVVMILTTYRPGGWLIEFPKDEA